VSWDMYSVPYWCLPNYYNSLLPLLDLHDQSLNHLCHTLQITGSQQCVLMKTIHVILIKIWTDVSVKISLTWFISWNMPDKWSRNNKTLVYCAGIYWPIYLQILQTHKEFSRLIPTQQSVHEIKNMWQLLRCIRPHD
jgi:hypothetical protein